MIRDFESCDLGSNPGGATFIRNSARTGPASPVRFEAGVQLRLPEGCRRVLRPVKGDSGPPRRPRRAYLTWLTLEAGPYLARISRLADAELGEDGVSVLLD